MTTLVVSPPMLKPSEPGLSGASAAALLRKLGARAIGLDASIEWHRFALEPTRLMAIWERAQQTPMAAVGSLKPGALEAMRRAALAFGQIPAALCRSDTYRSRARYSTAVAELEQALRLAALPFRPLRLGVSMVALEDGRRLESSAVLDELATTTGPFDDYFLERLLPLARREQVRRVAISLTFQQQGPATFRLAELLRSHAPHLERVLGGPLVACWKALGIDLGRAPFDRFDRVVAGTDADLLGLAEQPAHGELAKWGPRTGDLDELPWSLYLSPIPVVPAAFGRGCTWRRCTFCPDHLHPGHRCCSPESVTELLHAIATRFPEGAMVHFTDSALPIAMLEQVALVVARDRLPIRWHGFVRIEPALARPELARMLARGGCAMLQIGVETGSARLLELLGKPADPELTRALLRTTAQAGIRNQIYLLFGLPTETDEERARTLALVDELESSIHAINPALLNLPRGSRMHRQPEAFGISEIVPFGQQTDLSLYDDFRCGPSHPRTEARRWLARHFFKAPSVRRIRSALRASFKANHLCFVDS